jgi:hypothetical protein
MAGWNLKSAAHETFWPHEEVSLLGLAVVQKPIIA